MTFLLRKTLRASSLSSLHTSGLSSTSTVFITNSPSSPARTMSSESNRRIFQLKLNPLTGDSEWVVIEENEEQEPFPNYHNSLLATTSYLDMLNDSPRNRAFRQAIDKTITRPCHVLDIGAGTGLLSMMAARAMRGEGTVTACESYLPMVKLLRKVLNINRMGRNIKIFNQRSDELKLGVDITSRADVLVSEILDSELLGEGLIPSLQHAHDMLLVDNPLTVPFRATTYGQLVESAFLWKLNDLYNNEAKALDTVRLVPTGFNRVLRVKSQQHPMHCDSIEKEIKLLSEPFKIFEFDFWKRPDSHGETELLIKATNDGTVHAVISWWVLQLDQEGTIFYSTAPGWIDSSMHTDVGNWCDHWKQCVWFKQGEGILVSKGDEVPFRAVHSDTSVSYNLATEVSDVQQCDISSKDFHLILPPERIAIYGDSNWRASVSTALRNAVVERDRLLCLVADDSVLLTLLAACSSKVSHVIALFPGLRDMGAQYVQTVADANGLTADRVEVFQKKCLTLQDVNHKKIDLLIGEPYYYGNDGLPWKNLRFWKDRTMLDSILSEDVFIMPCKAILRACAMSLPDFWRSRRCLTEIEGFDHSVVNITLGACGNLGASQQGPILPFFVWQCGDIKELTETYTVMEFDFSQPIGPCHGKIQVDFTSSGICHGFVLWIDWVLDTKNSIILSTGPVQRYWKQGVKLLAQPVEVGVHGSSTAKHCSAMIEASFDPSSGELVANHTLL